MNMFGSLIYLTLMANGFTLPSKEMNIKLKMTYDDEIPCSSTPDTIMTKLDEEIKECEVEVVVPYSDCEFETYERLIAKDKEMRSLWREYYDKAGEIYEDDSRHKTDDYPIWP